MHASAAARRRVLNALPCLVRQVYGESSVGLQEGLQERSTLEPTNPYSAAKAGAEMMTKAYITSYNLPCIITRGNNVYGPHQFPEKLIPKVPSLQSPFYPFPENLIPKVPLLESTSQVLICSRKSASPRCRRYCPLLMPLLIRVLECRNPRTP